MKLGTTSQASCKVCGARHHPNDPMCGACWALLPREDRRLYTTKRRVWRATREPYLRDTNFHVLLGVKHTLIAKARHLLSLQARADAAEIPAVTPATAPAGAPTSSPIQTSLHAP
jgi:hypothetical protein